MKVWQCRNPAAGKSTHQFKCFNAQHSYANPVSGIFSVFGLNMDSYEFLYYIYLLIVTVTKLLSDQKQILKLNQALKMFERCVRLAFCG